MINQVKNNDVLYRDLRALGYEDDKIPAWWYSPGRDVAEGAETLQTVAEAGEGRTEVEGEEGYDPTPPRIPATKEGRPALLAQLSDPILCKVHQPSAPLSKRQQASPMLSLA